MFMLLTLDTARYERKILNLSYLQTETSRINVPIYKHAVIITFYILFNLTLFVYKNPPGLLNKDHEDYLKELAIHRTLSPDWRPHDFFSMRTSLKDVVFNTNSHTRNDLKETFLTSTEIPQATGLLQNVTTWLPHVTSKVRHIEHNSHLRTVLLLCTVILSAKNSTVRVDCLNFMSKWNSVMNIK